MLNHVAILKPPLPQLNVELVSWYITKSCFGVVHNIELGGGGETKFVLSMFNNFVQLAGMLSRVLSKIVDEPLGFLVSLDNEMKNLIKLHYLLFELHSTRPKFDI
jgi:hypothetical protein